jgi:hypothetical protein
MAADNGKTDHVARLLRDGNVLELTGTRMRFAARFC